jgi:hypothetical protein
MAISRLMKIVFAVGVDLILVLLYILRLYPFQESRYFLYAFAVLLASAFIASYIVMEKIDHVKDQSNKNYFMKPQQ